MSNNQLTTLSQNFLTDQSKLESAYRLANAFFKSKTFNHTISNPEQALTVLIAGNEAGLQPIEAMNSFYMVKGSLVMYGSALSKVITRAGIDIKFLERSKTKIKVQYSKNNEVIDTLEYSIQDLPAKSTAKGFAPEEKLVYHAHSRFLRYNDVGASVPYTDYDQEVIESNEPKKTDTKETENNRILEILNQKNLTLEELETCREPVVATENEDLINLFLKKEEQLKPKTSDGSLIEDKQPTTDV